MNVELADDLAALLPELNEPLDKTARDLFVLELYRRELISSGKAAELLGMSRWDFITFSGRRGVPYLRYSPGELEAELKTLERLLPPKA